MADYIFKRGDVGQTIVRELWQELVTETLDTTTGIITQTSAFQRIPLDPGDTVRLRLKDYVGGNLGVLTGGGICTVTNLATSEVSYTLVANDVNTVRTWAMEHEITKASTGEIITVPDEPDPRNGRLIPYLTVDIVNDLD